MSGSHPNRRLTPQEFAVARLESRRAERNEIERKASELTHGDEIVADYQVLQQDIEAGGRTLTTIAERAKAGFCWLGDAVRKWYRDYRAYKADRALDLDAVTPDVWNTMMFLTGGVVSEGTGAGVMMIADGKMGYVQGFAYGISFAAINISLGVFAGYFCIRYGWRSLSSRPLPRELKETQIARTGFWVCLAALGLLVYSAARTRATGSHRAIFDFSDVSLFATFADAYSIALICLGLLGGIVAIYKGAVGFADIEPGYSELREQAENRAQDEAYDILLDTEENISLEYEALCDELEVRGNDLKARASARESAVPAVLDRARVFNAGVLSDIEACHLYLREYAVIEGEDPDSFRQDLDFTAFHDLRISTDRLKKRLSDVVPGPLPSLSFADLTAARDQAIADVREGYAVFQTTAAKAARTGVIPVTNQLGVTHATTP